LGNGYNLYSDVEGFYVLDKGGTPEIFNTDQGSQFTSTVFIDVLKENGIRISMDGVGRATDTQVYMTTIQPIFILTSKKLLRN